MLEFRSVFDICIIIGVTSGGRIMHVTLYIGCSLFYCFFFYQVFLPYLQEPLTGNISLVDEQTHIHQSCCFTGGNKTRGAIAHKHATERKHVASSAKAHSPMAPKLKWMTTSVTVRTKE